MNSVHFNYFWEFFFVLVLKATTCGKWFSCLCAELALVVFKEENKTVSLLFYFDMVGQKLSAWELLQKQQTSIVKMSFAQFISVSA